MSDPAYGLERRTSYKPAASPTSGIWVRAHLRAVGHALAGLVGLAPSITLAGDTEAALAGLNLPLESAEPTWEESLTMPALVEMMSATRSRVCDLVAPLGLTEGALFDVKVAVGEALVSMLDENGSPQIVERAKIVPPRSHVGAITADQRKQIINSSPIAGHYEKAVDRESAYEKLQARAGEKVQRFRLQR